MVKEFQIRTKKRTFHFRTVFMLDSFIHRYQKSIMKNFIYLIDEKNNEIGKISVSFYVEKEIN
jgi:hypothetical protein